MAIRKAKETSLTMIQACLKLYIIGLLLTVVVVMHEIVKDFK